MHELTLNTHVGTLLIVRLGFTVERGNVMSTVRESIALTETTSWNEFKLRTYAIQRPRGGSHVPWRRPYPRNVFPVYAAAYLPWTKGGAEIDWESFKSVLHRIWACGAIPVVNADTGFAFHPKVKPMKAEILAWIQKKFPGRPFVAAVTPMNGEVFSAQGYNDEIKVALQAGATEIMVMISPGLTKLEGQALVDAYGQMELPEGKGILHELTRQFVPFGREFTPFEFAKILSLPGFGASKTSELFGNCMDPRIALKTDQALQNVRVLSGVDYCVEEAYEICDGVLMGAATIWPELYVLLWELRQRGCKDPEEMWKFKRLAVNLQSVATYQFLPCASHYENSGSFDVGGYRHHTAMFLYAQGTIACFDQPKDTEAFHLRESAISTMRANCALMQETLKAIGENPELVKTPTAFAF